MVVGSLPSGGGGGDGCSGRWLMLNLLTRSFVKCKGLGEEAEKGFK